jgi:hypothetical protein
MLDKFQDQDLMHSVEQLENALELIANKKELVGKEKYLEEDKAILHIKVAIDSMKKIHPSLFNYPRVARYMEEGEIRGEITRKYIKKLNRDRKKQEEMKKNADT